MSILCDKLMTPEDIRLLDESEILQLEKELRDTIIAVVSKNGGHLASNLGVIELTIALLRQYNFRNDKIVWDVGHQSYAYKILTGRKEQFCTLRKKDGLSGFPKRSESCFDCFDTGHSSTSISAALGMLRANKIMGKNDKVVAVIGDGALTGGMAFEALNDAGQSGLDLLVILNDNQMSIGRNVGGLHKHLDAIRVSKRYLNFKSKTARMLSRTPFGLIIKKFLEAIKDILKFIIKPSKVIFENLGFKYYGPVDGHDVNSLEQHLAAIKNITGPVLMHVQTQKGKGYEFAEVSPDKFHGVAPFEIANGLPKGAIANESTINSFSDAFACYLSEYAKTDCTITAISAAMTTGTGLDQFREQYPDRFFDVGIAEQHALTMAAGMACQGIKPVVAIYSTFLQRAYDQLLHDIVLQNLHVVICIDRAGIVGEDGETHQGIYDLSFLTGMPGITILSPRNYPELRNMLAYALFECNGPVAIRYPRGGERLLPSGFIEETINTETSEYTPTPILLSRGNDITIVSEGVMISEAADAARILGESGFSCDLIDIRRIKPIDIDLIHASVLKTGRLIVVENALTINGVGDMVEEALRLAGICVPMEKLGISDHPLCQGKICDLMHDEGMDALAIVTAALALINKVQ